MDASVERSGFGSQAESFQAEIDAIALDREVPGVFIRAPRFVEMGDDAQVIARLGDEAVGVMTQNRMALTVHPERSQDSGFHEWLLDTAAKQGAGA